MEEQEMSQESETNLSEGYCIKIHVLPDGFKVSDPEPIEDYTADSDDTTQDEPQEDEVIPDEATMLKNVLAVIKSNPVGGSEQQAFDATAAS
jgi:hypothetical protein